MTADVANPRAREFLSQGAELGGSMGDNAGCSFEVVSRSHYLWSGFTKCKNEVNAFYLGPSSYGSSGINSTHPESRSSTETLTHSSKSSSSSSPSFFRSFSLRPSSHSSNSVSSSINSFFWPWRGAWRTVRCESSVRFPCSSSCPRGGCSFLAVRCNFPILSVKSWISGAGWVLAHGNLICGMCPLDVLPSAVCAFCWAFKLSGSLRAESLPEALVLTRSVFVTMPRGM